MRTIDVIKYHPINQNLKDGTDFFYGSEGAGADKKYCPASSHPEAKVDFGLFFERKGTVAQTAEESIEKIKQYISDECNLDVSFEEIPEKANAKKNQTPKKKPKIEIAKEIKILSSFALISHSIDQEWNPRIWNDGIISYDAINEDFKTISFLVEYLNTTIKRFIKIKPRITRNHLISFLDQIDYIDFFRTGKKHTKIHISYNRDSKNIKLTRADGPEEKTVEFDLFFENIFPLLNNALNNPETFTESLESIDTFTGTTEKKSTGKTEFGNGVYAPFRNNLKKLDIFSKTTNDKSKLGIKRLAIFKIVSNVPLQQICKAPLINIDNEFLIFRPKNGTNEKKTYAKTLLLNFSLNKNKFIHLIPVLNSMERDNSLISRMVLLVMFLEIALDKGEPN